VAELTRVHLKRSLQHCDSGISTSSFLDCYDWSCFLLGSGINNTDVTGSEPNGSPSLSKWLQLCNWT
jgi:hypothetical protein